MSHHWVHFQEYCKARLSQKLDIGYRKVKVKVLVAQLCLTLCDLMDFSPPGSSVHGFSRQGYWSRLLFPSPGDLPDPGIEPSSPALQADSLMFEPPGHGSLIPKWMSLDPVKVGPIPIISLVPCF